MVRSRSSLSTSRSSLPRHVRFIRYSRYIGRFRRHGWDFELPIFMNFYFLFLSTLTRYKLLWFIFQLFLSTVRNYTVSLLTVRPRIALRVCPFHFANYIPYPLPSSRRTDNFNFFYLASFYIRNCRSRELLEKVPACRVVLFHTDAKQPRIFVHTKSHNHTHLDFIMIILMTKLLLKNRSTIFFRFS